MGQFEFVLTGTSLLIAIMLGRVIATLSEMRYRDADIRHVGWLVVLTFHLMIYWWFGWRYRDIEYTVHLYFMELIPTLALLFTVSVLTPRDSPTSWQDYFDERRQRFFAWYIAFWVLLAISQYVLLLEIRVSVIPLVLCALGYLFKSAAVQRTIPVLMGAAFVIIGLVFPETL